MGSTHISEVSALLCLDRQHKRGCTEGETADKRPEALDTEIPKGHGS